MNNHSEITQCPITDSTDYVSYFTLGNVPLVNNLCDTQEDSLTVDRFPLTLNYYPTSGLTSLDFAVDGNLLFSHYLYKSSVNIPYIEHCKKMFEFIQTYTPVKDGMKFVDVGGNDGTLLDVFKSSTKKQIDVLNIDPSKNLAEVSVQKGIPVLNEFFSAESIRPYANTIDVLTSTNVFQHLKDIDSFVKAVSVALANEGIWVLEFPYWLNDMLTNQFDQIYHEHMYYYTVTPLNLLMKKNGLRIINVTSQYIHGYSLRLVIVKESSSRPTDSSVEEYITNESRYGLDFYTTWSETVTTHIQKSKEFLLNLKKENKKIYGFGAAAKGCVYLNAMGIDHTIIDVVIDDTDIKQGKYIPGTGIEVVGREVLTNTPPDYILILAHNFSDYIIQSLSDVYKGKFILLLPDIKEVV